VTVTYSRVQAGAPGKGTWAAAGNVARSIARSGTPRRGPGRFGSLHHRERTGQTRVIDRSGWHIGTAPGSLPPRAIVGHGCTREFNGRCPRPLARRAALAAKPWCGGRAFERARARLTKIAARRSAIRGGLGMPPGSRRLPPSRQFARDVPITQAAAAIDRAARRARFSAPRSRLAGARRLRCEDADWRGSRSL
jgi:hypothetical protein